MFAGSKKTIIVLRCRSERRRSKWMRMQCNWMSAYEFDLLRLTVYSYEYSCFFVLLRWYRPLEEHHDFELNIFWRVQQLEAAYIKLLQNEPLPTIDIYQHIKQKYELYEEWSVLLTQQIDVLKTRLRMHRKRSRASDWPKHIFITAEPTSRPDCPCGIRSLALH